MSLKVINPKNIDYDDGETISFEYILLFLKQAWKTLLITASLGLLLGFTYFLMAPKKFEAVAFIKMAQISLTNPANPFGTPVEDPASLIARMQMPTNYNAAVIASCNFQEVPQAAFQLSKSLKLTAPKGLINTVELRVLSESPEIARNCAQAVVDQIALLQLQFAKPFVEEAKIKLAQDNERIDAARKLIIKADRGGSAMSAAYLSARDEITYFLTDREKMIDLINSAEQRGTKLISPIYVPENPVSPKKAISLLVGLITGLFFGLAIAIFRQFLANVNHSVKLGDCHD